MTWGVRFLQEGRGREYEDAVRIAATVPFGWMIGCPLLGFVSDRIDAGSRWSATQKHGDPDQREPDGHHDETAEQAIRGAYCAHFRPTVKSITIRSAFDTR